MDLRALFSANQGGGRLGNFPEKIPVSGFWGSGIYREILVSLDTSGRYWYLVKKSEFTQMKG